MPIDQDTLLRILLAERSKVLAYIRAMVRRRELAEDIFQDVCVLALEKRNQIADEQHLFAWLRTASRWTALNALRKQENRQKSLDDAVLVQLEAEWAAKDDTSGSSLSDALRECMDAMTEKARLMLRNRYTLNQTLEEIARDAARPVNSLYVTFSRIHTSLAECMDRKIQQARGRHA